LNFFLSGLNVIQTSQEYFHIDETKGINKTEIYNFAGGLNPRPLDVATNTNKKP
jgi:hypothetical protein